MNSLLYFYSRGDDEEEEMDFDTPDFTDEMIEEFQSSEIEDAKVSKFYFSYIL